MGSFFKIAGLLLFLLGKSILVNGQTPASVLSTGQWVKFSVTADGVYKIDYNLLKRAGIDADKIDPKKIKIYASGNGMLPQRNNAPRKGELTELAISVSGESDGRFDQSDLILFFGQGPDVYRYNTAKDMFDYSNNFYSDKNFYFMTVAASAGKRIASVESVSAASTVINEFDDFAYYEKDQNNIWKSGREWFGQGFDSEQIIKFEISGIVDNSEIKIASNVMAQSYDGSSFKLFFNGISVGEQFVAKIPNTTYGVKGRHAIDTFKINSTVSSATTRASQELKFQYIKSATGPSTGFLDHLLISFKRKLALYENQIIFSSEKSLENISSTFEVGSVTTGTAVWDVTDPFNAGNLMLTVTGSKAAFSSSTQELKSFVAFNTEKISFPDFESAIVNQNLRTPSPADLIIITHPDFKAEAERLAKHRINFGKISVRIVTIEEVYNDFSGGKQDITAIRDFARSAYLQGGLKNLLLFGRCSYDYKNRITKNTNYVPTYESINSLSPLETYSSDDYYTFFE